MSWRRIRAVARKEFLHIRRDPRSLIMALAVPLVMLLLFGYALSLDVDQIPTLVRDLDGTPASRELVSRFTGSRYFRVLGRDASYAEIERAVDRDRALVGVVIPRGFARDLERGREAQVQLLFDGSDSNTASIALAYTDVLANLYAAEWSARAMSRRFGAAARPASEPRIRVWYNSELKSRNYIVPGLMVVILTIIAALLTSLTIAREWENGSMEQLLSTPLRPGEIVLGKLAAYFTLGVVDTATAVLAGVFVFDVPLRGGLGPLAVTSCVFLVGALSWGVFLSAAARSQVLAFQMGILSSFLPAFLLSGFVYAIENMPLIVQQITRVFPARYFVTAIKGIFLKGVGLEVVWFELGMLALYGALVFALASKKVGSKVA